MQLRPELELDLLRQQCRDYHKDTKQVSSVLSCTLLLPWLRTCTVDFHSIPKHKETVTIQHRCAVLHHSVVSPCVVEHVVISMAPSAIPLPELWQFVQTWTTLTSFDLRSCVLIRELGVLLINVAQAHPYLRRLYLPTMSDETAVTQSALDEFKSLEVLSVMHCLELTNVHFCATTLRVLCANGCLQLTDAGLCSATNLEVLQVSNCREVTTVAPFAHGLLELDVSYSCSVSSQSLVNCFRLRVLNALENPFIASLEPFVERLREVYIGGFSNVLDDAALVAATSLVKLDVKHSAEITTVAPFGPTLRELDASFYSVLDDASLTTATNLVSLKMSSNHQIQTLTPFAATLLELDAADSSINDAALRSATHLVSVRLSHNSQVTTVEPFATSLRHLVADGSGTSLTNEGLSSATKLYSLDCRQNVQLTVLEPFWSSLRRVTVGGIVNISWKEVEACSALREIDVQSSKWPPEQLAAARFENTTDTTWVRSQV